MLRYGDLSSSQIAMLAVALQAYGNRPFGGKLLKASRRLGGLPGRGKGGVCVWAARPAGPPKLSREGSARVGAAAQSWEAPARQGPLCP